MCGFQCWIINFVNNNIFLDLDIMSTQRPTSMSGEKNPKNRTHKQTYMYTCTRVRDIFQTLRWFGNFFLCSPRSAPRAVKVTENPFSMDPSPLLYLIVFHLVILSLSLPRVRDILKCELTLDSHLSRFDDDGISNEWAESISQLMNNNINPK